MAKHETFQPTRLTLSMAVVGTALGSLVCVSNVYFGLRIGSISTMSASTALMAFAVFKAVGPSLRATFTPTENVVVQAIASSIASMPIAASLYSVIPAIEHLQDVDPSQRRHFSVLELIAWSLGVCFFGTIFSAPFRNYFIIHQKLRFPSPYAVGILLGYLHDDSDVVARAAQERDPEQRDEPLLQNRSQTSITYGSSSGHDSDEYEHLEGTERGLHENSDWLSKILIMGKFSAATACYMLVAYFCPILEQIPIFGSGAATEWLWSISLSPALISFGVILDAPVACSMLLGAGIGWGILSPIAKRNNWVPGSVDDLQDGARAWLTWISIGLLLGDALGKAVYFVARATSSFERLHLRSAMLAREADESTQPLMDESADRNRTMGMSSRLNYVSNRTIWYAFVTSSLLCCGCVSLLFWGQIPIYATLIAIVITLPICFIVIQSAGETDSVPSIALSNAAQFFFGLIAPNTSSSGLTTMTLGAITEAGLWQSAVLMGDLKTAYMLQASPRVMFKAQILGSAVGTVIGSCIYQLFSVLYVLPSQSFPIPMAYLWANTARLVNGGALPSKATLFALAAAALSACMRLLTLVVESKGWHIWVPSAVAMSMAMLVPPPVTLAKFVGAMLRLFFLQHSRVTEVDLMSAATGCILTEGTLGIIPALWVASK